MVKELLENAIDARSHRIDIDIERGGSSLIRISDDGDGISKDDLALAVSRHATSKVHTLDELEQVNSLGFRGEALASISAVSKLTIQSKPTDQEQAWMINTGTETDFANYQAEPEIVAHPEGTTIDVRDLFFNTPARRKFMRTVKTEFKHIDDIVKRIALSQFDIAFRLTHNKKIIRNLPKAVTEKAIAQRISKLFSPDFLAHANPVDFTSNEFSQIGQIRLWGWISQSQWHRSQPDWQYFYVNGRFIRDKLVNHALRQAYQDLLPADTYAAYLLYLEISPEQVDVNVHPTKHEVRFRQTRLVHDFIFSALNQTLGTSPLFDSHSAPSSDSILASNDNPEQYVNRYSQQHPGQHRAPSYQTSSSHLPNEQKVSEHLDGLKQLYQAGKETAAKDFNTRTPVACDLLGKPLTHINKRFLISQASYGDEIEKNTFIINVHRAQQYLLRLLINKSERTPLLIPHSCLLSEDSIQHFLRFQTQLNDWGLELDQLSEQTLVIRGLPSVNAIPGCQIDPEKLIHQLLDALPKQGAEEGMMDYEHFIDALSKSIFVVELSFMVQEQLLTLLSQQLELQGAETSIQVDGKAVCRKLDDSSMERLFNQ